MLRGWEGNWGPPALLSLKKCDLSQICSKKSEQTFPCALGDHQIIHLVCPGGIAYMPSAQEYDSILRTLSQPNAPISKTPVFESPDCKNSWKSGPLFFPADGFGEVSLCIFCVLHCFFPFSATRAPPTCNICVHFSPQSCPHTSYLPLCGFFSPPSCAVCSVNPQIDFFGIQNDFILI